MILLVLYLVLDHEHPRPEIDEAIQFAVDNSPIKCAILLGMDLFGLFLQILRWSHCSATSTM